MSGFLVPALADNLVGESAPNEFFGLPILPSSRVIERIDSPSAIANLIRVLTDKSEKEVVDFYNSRLGMPIDDIYNNNNRILSYINIGTSAEIKVLKVFIHIAPDATDVTLMFQVDPS